MAARTHPNRLPLLCALAVALASCAGEPARPAEESPATRSPYPGVAQDSSQALENPCIPDMHIEHCLARLIREKAIHCDPAAAPIPVVHPAARYPSTARAQGTTGRVEVEAKVSPAGAPQNIRVIGSEPPGVFDDEAIRSFKRWRYCPKAHRGKWVRAEIHFPARD